MRLKNLPHFESEKFAQDVEERRKKIIQEILPPGYIFNDDGSVIQLSTGRVIILPENVAAADVHSLPLLDDTVPLDGTLSKVDIDVSVLGTPLLNQKNSDSSEKK